MTNANTGFLRFIALTVTSEMITFDAVPDMSFQAITATSAMKQLASTDRDVHRLYDMQYDLET